MWSLALRVLPPHVEANHERPRLLVLLVLLVDLRLSSSGYSSTTVSGAAVSCVTNGCPIPTCQTTYTQTELAATLTRTASAVHGGVVSILRRTVCAGSHKQRSSQLYR